MRSFALAALLPLACLAAAQDTGVHVTYTSRAARAEKVLGELSALTKVQLEASPQTQNEVLILSVKDVSLSDLMARIATATSGEWKQTGAIYRLVASATLRKQEDRQEEAKRVAMVKKAIESRASEERKQEEEVAKVAAEAEKKAASAKGASKTATADKGATTVQKSGGDDDDEVEGPQPAGPDEAAFTNLLLGLDPAVLAQMEAGDREVFSSDPTRTQRTLGENATEVVNALIEKHNATVANIPADANATALAGMDEQQAEFFRKMMSKQTGKIGQVAKALLVASRQTMYGVGFDSLELELRLYDAKGHVAYTTSTTLSLSGETMQERVKRAMEAAKPEGAAAAAKAAQTRTLVEYSDDSKALLASTKGVTAGRFSMQFSRELRQKLFLPYQYDPLSFSQTDELFSFAKSKGKPFVADVPDEFGSAMSFVPEQSKTVEMVAADIEQGSTLVTVPDESFTVLKPAQPAWARSRRLDRNALTALMQATEEKGVPSLDDLAAYASVAPDPMEGGIGQSYLMMFVPGATGMGLDGQNSWDMLRFYAQLSPAARTNLLQGGKLSIGSLSSGQRALVDRMTYGAAAKLHVDDGKAKPEDAMPAWMSFGMDNQPDDYRGEPTEVVPNGIPSEGYMELRGTTEPFAAPVPVQDSMTMGMLGVLGVDELAMFKMMRSMKGAEQFASMFPAFPKLHVGESSVLNFTFYLAPQVSVKHTLKDHRLAKDSPIYSEDNLPADFQKLIADQTEALKKSPFGSMGNMFGNAQPVHP